MSTLLVMAGGTGGHVYPALAVARNLRERGVSVIWLGTRGGFEARAVPAAGFEIEWVSVSGLRGKGIVRWLLLPFVMIRAMAQTSKIITARQPDALLGMGGFVAGPGGVMAWLRRRPLVIHEQNAICGLTNRMLARIASLVLAGFPSCGLTASHVEWIGNPVREDIAALPAPDERRRQRQQPDCVNILILGGSQGADTLNRGLGAILGQLPAPVSVWHQSGRGKLNAVNAAYAQTQLAVNAVEFIDDMAQAYAWADIVVCRAGAMTVAEVSAAGIAAIFVPYPYAVDDHQAANAQVLVEHDAAYLVREGSGFAAAMTDKLNALCSQPSKRLEMAANSRALSRPHAAQAVADRCMEVMHA